MKGVGFEAAFRCGSLTKQDLEDPPRHANDADAAALELALGPCEDLMDRIRSSRLLAIKVSGEFLTFLIVGKLHGKHSNDRR